MSGRAREVDPDVRAAALLSACCGRSAARGRCGCPADGTPRYGAVEHPGELGAAGPLAAPVLAELARIAGGAPTPNRVRLLLDGTQSYAAMLSLIDGARERIRFENFIFRADAAGHAFAAALQRRAEEGVDVRVLHDPFGSLMSRRAPIGLRFRRSPVQVRVYNPPRLSRAFLRDGRDHRKLVAADGAVAVVGGMCLADVWIGNCVSRCTWRDSAVEVEGPAAEALEREFDGLWARGRSFTRRPAAPASRRPKRGDARVARAHGRVPVRVLADRPGERRVERALVVVLDAAEREVFLTTPYLVPTAAVCGALCRAAARGVAVEVLVPAHNNHRVVALTMTRALRVLLRAGVVVRLWQGPLVHAKTVVVDGRWSLLGSSNLDPLSLVRNAELNLEIHGGAFGEQLRETFARDCRAAERLTQEMLARSGPALDGLAWVASRFARWQ